MALKICIAIPAFPEASPPDDALQACITMANEFADSGHDISLALSACTPTHKPTPAPQQIFAGMHARVIHLPALTETQVIAGWFRRRSYELYRWMQSQVTPFDCVVSPAWQGIAYYAILARQQRIGFANTRFITHISDPTQWRYQARMAMPASLDALEVMFMERQVVSRTDTAVIGTAGLHDWLKNSGWTLPRNTRIIPPSPTPDAKARRPMTSLGASATSREPENNAGPSAVTTEPIRELVFTGRMDTADGIELFCDAIKTLPVSLHKQLTFSFIGTIGEVGQLAGDWYVTRNLRRTGCQYSIKPEPMQRKQLQYLRGAGRVAVFAAGNGALPQIMVDCVTSGIPVLISENCGLRDYLPAAEFRKHCFTPTAAGLSGKIQTIVKDGITGLYSPTSQQSAAQHWETLFNTLRPAECPAGGALAHEWTVGSGTPADGTMPLISVCLVHYNRPATLKQAVDSLKAQTHGNYEVILVDDGSPSSEAQTFLDSLEGEFAARKWRIIRQENQYMWRARNEAARHAQGDYLAFMDDDNIAHPHWLAWASHVAQQTQADVVTSTMTLFQGTEPPDRAVLYPMWVPLGPAASAGAFMNVFGDVHCLVKRGVFEALGGFEERFSGYQEDWEFFARAVLAGHKLELIPEPLLFYRISKNSVSRSSDQNWNANRGCSTQPYLHAIGAQLCDLFPFMVENQRLYAGVAAKRAASRWKRLRQANRWLRGRAADAPVVVQTTADALRAAGAIPQRRQCPRA